MLALASSDWLDALVSSAIRNVSVMSPKPVGHVSEHLSVMSPDKILCLGHPRLVCSKIDVDARHEACMKPGMTGHMR
jgi:hypothetical protein